MNDALHFVVPDSIDDPARPSGGNVYDREVCAELTRLGWSVQLHRAPGRWPAPTPGDLACLATTLGHLEPSTPLLVDGLIASAAPALVTGHAARARTAVLVHLPLGVLSPDRRGPEAAMLHEVAAVVTTSTWTRSWLVSEYGLSPDSVTVALPGTSLGALAPGTPTGGSLLCVGAVTPVKGHDILVDALAALERTTDRAAWRCTCIGSLTADPGFARAVAERAHDAGIGDRIVFTGPRDVTALRAAYREADVLVLASRAETYGMVVTEALGHGLPVIGVRAGGVPEAMGTAADGTLPGLLVAAGDADELSGALASWLADPSLRDRLRSAALDRRGTLPTWRNTAERVGATLGLGEPSGGPTRRT